jgi:hypothetical protein
VRQLYNKLELMFFAVERNLFGSFQFTFHIFLPDVFYGGMTLLAKDCHTSSSSVPFYKGFDISFHFKKLLSIYPKNKSN